MTTTTPTTAAPEETDPDQPVDTGDVEGFPVGEVSVDGEALAVAIADNRGRRIRGLRGVTELGELSGMLFSWGEPTASVFTMEDTLIPLDIAFLDRNGTVLATLEMEPCVTSTCPKYGVDPVFWFALESPLGSLGLEPGDEVGLP